LLIIASQLPVALGVHAHGRNELYRAGWALSHAAHWSTEAIAIGALVSVVLLLGKRIHPLFPGMLLAVVAAILYSKFVGYGGAKLGTVRAGLPPVTTSLPLGDLPHLIVPAFVIALLGFAEASSIARTYARPRAEALGREPRVRLARWWRTSPPVRSAASRSAPRSRAARSTGSLGRRRT